jgi:hypothetical protein
MGRFIKPQVTRLNLTDDDFIDVKARLNTGEYHELFARLSPHVTPGEVTRFDTRVAGTAKVLSYLVGWRFKDDAGPVAYSLDMSESARQATLNNLDPDAFREIREAIEKHEETTEAEIAAKKNGRISEKESPVISPSVSASTGDLVTSTN